MPTTTLPVPFSHTCGNPLAPMGALPRGFGYGPAVAARFLRFVAGLCAMSTFLGSGKTDHFEEVRQEAFIHLHLSFA